MVVAKKWMYVKEFSGEPNESNMELSTENLPDTLQENEVLCEAVYLSVDPYMRLFPNKVGDIMPGEQVARITASKNTKFPVGSFITGQFGWRTHTIADESKIKPLQDYGDLPISLALGTLGMPGMTAYFGFLGTCEPKAGEVVYVNAASGTVGNVVGQIAKLKGCKVIGSAGTEEKCRWLRDDLHFDEVFNYKTIKLDEALKQAAPGGIDIFFDNVGGLSSNTVIEHLKMNGRVAVCGLISTYNLPEEPSGRLIYKPILLKQLKVQGITGWAHVTKWPDAQKEIMGWIKEGKMQYRETIIDGFENMPKAFLGLFNGSHIGKAVVKLS